MAREINLVPDVKGEMIKALKLRNFIFFLCIVVASASLVLIAGFAAVAGAQQSMVDGKKETLNALSSKLNGYSDLSDFLTIKDQLGNLSSISNNKKLLSRTFGILSAFLPAGSNSITISKLNINLSAASPTISFDAQANANEPPYIDYTVLDSFKKSMQYLRYDYGHYVDKKGANIPAYCIIESGNDGATFYDSTKGYYAFWLVTGEGCNPSYTSENSEGNDTISDAEMSRRAAGYNTEEYNGQTVVRIWRTPQYNEWYKESASETEPYMTLSGEIGNVAHFSSECIKYTGEKGSDGGISWSSTNETCLLVPSGIDGIKVSDSSNGRDSSGDLVLRFSAIITLNPDVYKFTNNHMLAIGPTGRYNVTDSYVQIQNMFEQRAADCSEDDAACNNTNSGGNN